MQQHDSIEIDVCESVLNGGWEALEQYRADLLVGAPGPVPQQKGYRAHLLEHVDLVAVIACNHKLADSINEAVAFKASMSRLRRVITHDTSRVNVTRSAGFGNKGKQLFVQNIDQKVEAIMAGIGIGHLPRHRVQHHLDSGELIELIATVMKALWLGK